MKGEHSKWEGVVDDGSQLEADEVEYALAMDRYKRNYHRPFPTCSECLAVLLDLGYRKLAAPSTLPIYTVRPLSRVRTERGRLERKREEQAC